MLRASDEETVSTSVHISGVWSTILWYSALQDVAAMLSRLSSLLRSTIWKSLKMIFLQSTSSAERSCHFRQVRPALATSWRRKIRILTRHDISVISPSHPERRISWGGAPPAGRPRPCWSDSQGQDFRSRDQSWPIRGQYLYVDCLSPGISIKIVLLCHHVYNKFNISITSLTVFLLLFFSVFLLHFPYLFLIIRSNVTMKNVNRVLLCVVCWPTVC